MADQMDQLRNRIAEVERDAAEWMAHARAATGRADRAQAKLDAVAKVLGDAGCECECDHHHDEHDDDCERCLGCRIEMAMEDAADMAVANERLAAIRDGSEKTVPLETVLQEYGMGEKGGGK